MFCTKYVSLFLKQTEKKYLDNPSSYLKIPGNKIRLQGIQDYFVTSNKQTNREHNMRDKRRLPKTSVRNDRSRSPLSGNQNQEHQLKPEEVEKDGKILVSTIKTQLKGLKVLSSDEVALLHPSVSVFMVGNKKQAVLTCMACANSKENQEQKTTTVYCKGKKSWIVSNYKRHVTRYHLEKESPTKKDGSLDSFIQKTTKDKTIEEAGGTEENNVIPLSDEEEESRINEFEKNFLRKE